MKRSIFITLLIFLTISISAQKAERKAIRSGNKSYKSQLYGTAEGDYAKALEVNASSKEASFNLANTYYKQQRWDDALNEYQHYLKLETENPEKISAAWSNIGNTFLKKKASESSQNQPQNPGQMKGPQKKEEDNLKQCMEAYKNALRYNPKDNDTRYNLAVVQKMIQDQEGGGGDSEGDNKDDNKDQDKDNKDQNKDKKDQNKDNKNQDQNKDKKDQNKDQNKDKGNQMSQDNIQQILQALEQDEKETQGRVKEAKANERRKQSDRNKRQNKDW